MQVSSLEIGTIQYVYITIHEWKAGNDITEIYSISDTSKSHIPSDVIIIDRFEEITASNPFTEERKFLRSDKTKSYNMIKETYETVTHPYLMDHYKVFLFVSVQAFKQ